MWLQWFLRPFMFLKNLHFLDLDFVWMFGFGSLNRWWMVQEVEFLKSFMLDEIYSRSEI
jgi:hypothetical protein